ncbi:MAG: hypothetical protein WBI10_11115 [Syntrophales bacterium]|jgi:hypothetical protein
MTETYYEVVVEGSFDLIKGFVLGFLQGRRIEGEAVFSAERHIRRSEGVIQLLRQLTRRGNKSSIIIGRGVGRLLREALERIGDDLDLKVLSVREIKSAHFDFEFRTYAKKAGESLEETFRKLPPGVTLEGFDLKEDVHPEAKGVEAYAPLHHYEIRGKGRVAGDAKAVIDFYDRIEHNELIKLGDIRLEFP